MNSELVPKRTIILFDCNQHQRNDQQCCDQSDQSDRSDQSNQSDQSNPSDCISCDSSSNSTKVIANAMYALFLFERCIQQVKELTVKKQLPKSVAPYLRRNFKLLSIVNYLYPPNLEMIQEMEEVFYKSQIDAEGVNRLSGLRILIQFIQLENFFDNFKHWFGISKMQDSLMILERSTRFLFIRALALLDSSR